MRNRSEANKVFPDSVFILLYNVGLSSSQVAILLGVSSSTVTKRLQSINFPLRLRKVACSVRYTDEEFEQHFLVPEIISALTKIKGEY